jgi:putative endonuclease
MDQRNIPAVYILSNRYNTVLYVGVTHRLVNRILQHKQKRIPGFTKKYNIDKLVYYEFHSDIRDAIAREKQLKAGSRKKKVDLIESINPRWENLYDKIV